MWYIRYGCGLVEWEHFYDERRRFRGRLRRVHLSVYNLFEPAVEWEFLVCGLSCVTVIKKMTWDVCENRTGVNLYWKKRKRKSWASSDIVAKHSNRQGKNLEVTWQGTNDKQWDEINEWSCISLCAIRGQRVSYGPCYPSIHYFLEKNRNVCNLECHPSLVRPLEGVGYGLAGVVILHWNRGQGNQM